MKKIIAFLAITLAISHAYSQKFELFSPDTRIHVAINTDKVLTYEVLLDGKQLIKPSLIDMMLSNGAALSKDHQVKSTNTKAVSTSIIAQIPVNRKNIPDVYNELTIQFKNNFAVIFRAYNDGVA